MNARLAARRLFPMAALLTLALALASCIQTDDTITLNPDGSGKAYLDITEPGDINLDKPGAASAPSTPAANAKALQHARQAVVDMVHQTQGVDAWSDVTYTVTKDGKVNIKATAYFPDIAKFKTGGSMPATWTKSPQGGMVLTLKPEDVDGPASMPATAPTDAEIAAQVKSAKDEYKKNKPMLGMVYNTLHLQTTYVLPGTVTESQVFTTTPKGLQIVVDGKKVMASMDKVMADDKLLTQNLKEGRKADTPDFALVFGAKGPVTARCTADKPSFDYKAEMQKAKAGQDAMFKKLGVDLTPTSAPATTE